MAAVNANDVESLFSGETSVTVPAGAARMMADVNYLERLVKGPTSSMQGIEILRNYPNPFDESTYVVLKNDAERHISDAYLTIRKGDGTLVEKRKIQIVPGINEYLFDYKNDGRIEVFYYTFEADNQVIATNRMLMKH